MTAPRNAIAALVTAGALAAAVLLKGASHADEVRAVIGPTARAAVEEIGEAPVGEAMTAAQAAQALADQRGEKPGTE